MEHSFISHMKNGGHMIMPPYQPALRSPTVAESLTPSRALLEEPHDGLLIHLTPPGSPVPRRQPAIASQTGEAKDSVWGLTLLSKPDGPCRLETYSSQPTNAFSTARKAKDRNSVRHSTPSVDRAEPGYRGSKDILSKIETVLKTRDSHMHFGDGGNMKVLADKSTSTPHTSGMTWGSSSAPMSTSFDSSFPLVDLSTPGSSPARSVSPRPSPRVPTYSPAAPIPNTSGWAEVLTREPPRNHSSPPQCVSPANSVKAPSSTRALGPAPAVPISRAISGAEVLAPKHPESQISLPAPPQSRGIWSVEKVGTHVGLPHAKANHNSARESSNHKMVSPMPQGWNLPASSVKTFADVVNHHPALPQSGVNSYARALKCTPNGDLPSSADNQAHGSWIPFVNIAREKGVNGPGSRVSQQPSVKGTTSRINHMRRNGDTMKTERLPLVGVSTSIRPPTEHDQAVSREKSHSNWTTPTPPALDSKMGKMQGASGGQARAFKSSCYLPMMANPDTTGRTAWRRGERPTKVFSLPKRFDALQAVIPRINEISEVTDTHIHPSWVGRGACNIDLKIYGNQTAVDEAVRRIKIWAFGDTRVRCSISRPIKSSSDSGFAKIPAFNKKRAKELQKRYLEDMERQRYRKDPPEDLILGWEKDFKWPVPEVRPEEVLGSNFEALDPIRMETGCFIIRDSSASRRDRIFRLKAVAEQPLLDALERLNNLAGHIKASAWKPNRLCVINRYEELSTRFIRLEHYRGTPGIDEKRVPKLYEPPSDFCTDYKDARCLQDDGDDEEFWADLDKMTMTTEYGNNLGVSPIRMLEKAIYRGLDCARCFPGVLQFRVHLGTLNLAYWRKSKDHVLPIKALAEMIGPFNCREPSITQGIGNDQVEGDILRRVVESEDIFTNKDILVTNLAKARPIYSATFTISEANINYYLQVEWVDIDGVLQKNTDWGRYPSNGVRNFLDAALVDVKDGLAWHFEIVGFKKLNEEKVPPRLRHFAKNMIELDAKAAATNGNHPFITYQKTGFLSIVHVQQKRSWQYYISGSEYVCEIAQVITVKWKDSQAVVEKPYWSLSVWNQGWSASFGSNLHLKAGSKAKWENVNEKFFPVSDCLEGISRGAVRASTVYDSEYESEGENSADENEEDQMESDEDKPKIPVPESEMMSRPKALEDDNADNPMSQTPRYEGFAVLLDHLAKLKALATGEDFD